MEFVNPQNTLSLLRSSFHMCPCIPDRIGIWQCWCLRKGEKLGYAEKNLTEQEKTNNNLNPQMMLGPESNSGYIWGGGGVGRG